MLTTGDVNLDSSIKNSSKILLVDFWAPWCGPCKVVGKILDGIVENNPDKLELVKINVDEQQSMASSLGITSLPTVLVIEGGIVKEQIIGSKTKQEFEQKLGLYF